MLKIAVITCAGLISAVGAAQAVVSLDRARAPVEAPAAETQAAVMETPAPLPVKAVARASGRAAQIAKSPDGHYWADAKVNNRNIRFLVDTGASAVALSLADARKLGFSMGELNFDHRVATANGEALAAKVTLRTVAIDQAKVEDVEAFVIEKGLDASLLGMSYLGRLEKIEATRDSLILRP